MLPGGGGPPPTLKLNLRGHSYSIMIGVSQKFPLRKYYARNTPNSSKKNIRIVPSVSPLVSKSANNKGRKNPDIHQNILGGLKKC